MCGAEKQLQRVCTHRGAVRRWKSQWTTDFSRNSGTYIVYNSHVTCSNSSFSLTMVVPTSHFPLVRLSASHWLLAQVRFCGRTHLPLSLNSITPTVQVIFWYLRPDAPVFNITTVGMVTFRQSLCWYYPWADVALSTSSDTQHLWTWHFGDHNGLINLSTTSAVFTPAGHVNILQLSFDKQNSHTFLILFLVAFDSSHISWPEEGCLLFASQTCLPVMGSFGQLTCLIFPLCRFDVPAASYHMGFLANRHSAFKLVSSY